MAVRPAHLANGCSPRRSPERTAQLRRTAAAERPVTEAELEPRLVKGSFAQIASAGPAAMEYFYARLFAFSPDTRALFPMSMTAQRERMFAALTRIVWSLDNQPGCTEILTQLGRSHRKFGVTERHYPIFFAALRDTAERFTGAAGRKETAAAWQVALDFIAVTMKESAAQDARNAPPWWIAEIVSHELRAPGVAVLRLGRASRCPIRPGSTFRFRSPAGRERGGRTRSRPRRIQAA